MSIDDKLDSASKNLEVAIANIKKETDKVSTYKHQRDMAMIIVNRILYRKEWAKCSHFFDLDTLIKQLESLKKEVLEFEKQ